MIKGLGFITLAIGIGLSVPLVFFTLVVLGKKWVQWVDKEIRNF